jgi:hypothetical protein
MQMKGGWTGMRTVVLAIAAMAVFGLFSPLQVSACEPDDLVCMMVEARDHANASLGMAAIQLLLIGRGGDRDEASTYAAEASGAAADLVDLVADPKLLKKILSYQKKVQKVLTDVNDDAKKGSAVVKSIKAAIVAGDKLPFPKPMLAELNAKTAGFHKPGEEVTFAVYTSTGEPCTDTIDIEIESPFGSGNVVQGWRDNGDGTFTLTMGSDAGGARVTATACGQTSSRLLYNYGPKAVSGVPPGFPTNLEPGNYQMCYSGPISGCIGPIPLTNLKAFAKIITGVIDSVMASLVVPPGCSAASWYTPAVNDSFSFSFTVTCCVPDAGCSTVTMTFTISRV